MYCQVCLSSGNHDHGQHPIPLKFKQAQTEWIEIKDKVDKILESSQQQYTRFKNLILFLESQYEKCGQVVADYRPVSEDFKSL